MTDIEKLESINKLFKFPCRIAFHLKRKADGDFTIVFMKIRDSKKKLENIRFNEIQSITLDGSVMTPIHVADFDCSEALLGCLDSLSIMWLGEE